MRPSLSPTGRGIYGDGVHSSVLFPKFLDERREWGGPPGPRPTPSSALLRVRGQSRTRGSGADEGVRPTRHRYMNFRNRTLANQ